jgi:DNA repair protein SbcD/Mre11
MRILHTSDWHLGARIGRVDRADDAFARIDELGQVIDREQIDLLLVAGDIFDETRTTQLGGLVRRLAERLAPRLADGLRAVFVAGNHDRDVSVFPLLQATSQLFGAATAERVSFVQKPAVLEIPNRDATQAVALACVPYPTHFRYDLEATGWPSRDVRNRELAEAVRARIGELAEEVAARHSGLPAVMAAHLLVRGTQVGHGAYCLTEAEDVPVERGDFQAAWDYVALGHIHKPQQLGHPNIRYSGSIERMDLGEADDSKEAVIVSVDGRAKVATRSVLLDATPFTAIEAASEDELRARRDGLEEPERTLVSLTLKVDGIHSVTALIAAAHQLFPRLYREPEILRTHPTGAAGSVSGFDRADVAGTVRRWLKERLMGDSDAEAVLALAEELLAGGEPATAPASRGIPPQAQGAAASEVPGASGGGAR